VHCKSIAAQETRALLTARKLVQVKLHDIELSLRGILRGFGQTRPRRTDVSRVKKGIDKPRPVTEADVNLALIYEYTPKLRVKW
jgi:hypothetical protein